VEKNQMSFWDHLDELRARLVKCLWIFFIGFIGFYFLSDRLLDLLRHPLFQYLPPEKRQLYYTSLFENFFVHLRIAGYASLLFLSPVYFFILWGFISPGLHPNERKTVLPFALFSSLFFLIGSAFAYFVLFPAGVKYFLSYGTQAEVPWLTLESYVSLILKILLGFGIAFQLPIAMVLLAKVGILTAATLVTHRKTAIVIITLIAALIAPPDGISMLLLMVPLYLLFEGAVFFIQRIEAKNALGQKKTPNTKEY
jgi:sec-independent protein translocase protein TatC